MPKLHGKNVRVYLDGYDLSGDSNSVEPGFAADVVDISCFGDTSKTYVVGLADPQIRWAGVYNDAANREHAVGSGRVGSQVMWNAAFGETRGNRGVGGSLNVSEYSVSSPISGAVAFSANITGGGATGIYEHGLTTILPKGSVPGGGGGPARARAHPAHRRGRRPGAPRHALCPDPSPRCDPCRPRRR